jgi:hypothetical protein
MRAHIGRRLLLLGCFAAMSGSAAAQFPGAECRYPQLNKLSGREPCVSSKQLGQLRA